MNHRAFVKDFPSKIKTELSSIDDKANALHLFIHVGLIILIGTLIAMKISYWPLLIVPQGVLIIFLFTVEHEATHISVFSNQNTNDLVGRAIGFLILLPFEWFRYFHLAHHRYTNIVDKDPELSGGQRPDSWTRFGWHISGIPNWVAMTKILLSNAFDMNTETYIPKNAILRVQNESRIMLFAYLALGFSLIFTPLLFWVWLLPTLIGQPFLRLFLLAEHGQCPQVANMFENTRTTFTNRVVRFLTWNASYHIEHHTFPNVPSHNLPKLHQHMSDEIKVISNGYLEFASEYPKKFQN